MVIGQVMDPVPIAVAAHAQKGKHQYAPEVHAGPAVFGICYRHLVFQNPENILPDFRSGIDMLKAPQHFGDVITAARIQLDICYVDLPEFCLLSKIGEFSHFAFSPICKRLLLPIL